MSIAAIDVDPQQCFTSLCPDELPIEGGEKIASELNNQAKLANYRVLTKDAHTLAALWIVEHRKNMQKKTGLKNADLTWVAHAIPGTKGYEILPELPHFSEYDYIVWKGIEPCLHPYGACFHDIEEKLSTGLIEWLASKSVHTVIIGGLALDICVKMTAIQLATKGNFNVIVNSSACRGTSLQNTEKAKTVMLEAGIKFMDNYLTLKQYLSSATV